MFYRPEEKDDELSPVHITCDVIAIAVAVLEDCFTTRSSGS